MCAILTRGASEESAQGLRYGDGNERVKRWALEEIYPSWRRFSNVLGTPKRSVGVSRKLTFVVRAFILPRNDQFASNLNGVIVADFVNGLNILN